MAEIHSLPYRANPSGSARLASLLEGILQSGLDPGPRGLQIRTLGVSLKQMNDELREIIDSLSSAIDAAGSEPSAKCEELAQAREVLSVVYGNVARLTAMALEYPT